MADSREALAAEVERLEAELAAAREALASVEAHVDAEADEILAMEEPVLEESFEEGIYPEQLLPFLKGLRIGGAVRVNLYVGDYTQDVDTSATRGGTGVAALDTFRINLDYERGPWIGHAEYRFYPGYGANNADSYHFPRAAWVGYQLDQKDQIIAGLNRAPFGPGPFGVSQSWFFDQHYYVGLSDNMNLGIKYTVERIEDWTLDFAYYARSAPRGGGNNFSRQSSRFSYDVVDETGLGYEESHQFNLRAIYQSTLLGADSSLGASFLYQVLDSNGRQSNGDRFAASVHSVLEWGNWNLTSQLSYSKFNVDYQDADGVSLTRDLVTMGAYDFPTEVAAEMWIPAVSLSYLYETPTLTWLDSVRPFVEYSSLLKPKGGFNDSNFITLGSAWASGNWYIYSEMVFSDGNDFVGNREVSAPAEPDATGALSGQFGANENDRWQTRFNLNFGYYF